MQCKGKPSPSLGSTSPRMLAEARKGEVAEEWRLV